MLKNLKQRYRVKWVTVSRLDLIEIGKDWEGILLFSSLRSIDSNRMKAETAAHRNKLAVSTPEI